MLIVNSTELQNNFGKYLVLADREDITVTRNGIPIAKLTGIAHKSDTAREKAEAYPVQGTRTYEDFLEITQNSEDRYEFIDGEIYLLSSPKIAHQYSLTEVFGQFYNWFKGKQCLVFSAPNDIKLKRNPDRINVVQPDLMVICDLDEKTGDDGYYTGIPVLIVEIISESTRSKDMVKKLALYMDCGVEEYWVVNPLNREVTVYQFKNSEISDSKTFKQKEIAESCIFPGLTVAVSTIFK